MPTDRDHWPHDWSPPAPAGPAPVFDAEQFAEQLGAVFAGFAEIWQAWARAVGAVYAELLAAGLVTPVPPHDDVRARALVLRRTRNTGPPLRPLGRR